MKKILTMTLALCFAVAASATNYALWVAGKQVTDANRTDILGNGRMRLEHDPDGGYALILDGLNYMAKTEMDYFINTVNYSGLANAERVYPLKVVFSGQNIITTYKEGYSSEKYYQRWYYFDEDYPLLIKTAFNLDGDTRFVGTGTLVIDAENYGIDLQKWREKSTLSFDEGYVDIATNNYNCIQTDDRSRLELNDATLRMKAYHKKGPYNDRKTSIIHYSDQGYMKYPNAFKLDNHSARVSGGANVHDGWYYGACPIKTGYDINDPSTQQSLYLESLIVKEGEWVDVKPGSGRWKYSQDKNLWSLDNVNYTSKTPELHLLREGMLINVSGDCHIKVDKLVLGGSVEFTGDGTLTIETKYGCVFQDPYRQNQAFPLALKMDKEVKVNITSSSDYAIQTDYPQNFIVSLYGSLCELKVKGYKGATKRFGYFEYGKTNYVVRERYDRLPEGVTINDNGELIQRNGSSTANKEVLIRIPRQYGPCIFSIEKQSEYYIDETNYFDLTLIPLVTVDAGGYARYNPASKAFEFKNVSINGSINPGKASLYMVGTNTIDEQINVGDDIAIIGEGSKQSSKLTINNGIMTYYDNGPTLKIVNMTMDIKSGENSSGIFGYYGALAVQWVNSAGTITGKSWAVYMLSSFTWEGCYLNSPSNAKFDYYDYHFKLEKHCGEFVDSQGNSVKTLTFGANDASMPPLTANLVLTGVDVNINNPTKPTTTDGYVIPASDEQTTVDLKPGYLGSLMLQCNIKGNGTTSATVTTAPSKGKYFSANTVQAGANFSFNINVNGVPPMSGKVNVGLRTQDGDTLYTNWVSYRVPREMKISGPLYYSTDKHDWKWVEAGESTTALVYEGDTVWCNIAESDHACYPTIKTVTLLGLNNGYYEYYQANLKWDIEPEHTKKQVAFYEDAAKEFIAGNYMIYCGEEINSSRVPNNPNRTGATFLGWAIEGTTEPLYSKEDMASWVVTEDVVFIAVFSNDITGGDNDKKDLDYGIVVADIPVTDINADDILRDGEYDEATGNYLNPSASYDPATRTITLRDYEFTGEQPLTINSSEEDLTYTVRLEGQNKLELEDVNFFVGLNAEEENNTLIFNGPGSMDVTGGFMPLGSTGNLLFDGTTVTVHETSGLLIAAAIMAEGDLTFRSCHVTMDGSNVAATAERILLDGDAEIATEDVVINNNIGKFVYTKDADATSPSGLIVPKYVEIVGLPLGITHTHAGETNLQKILYNGQLYIQREGRIYNAHGAVVNQ